MRLSFFTDPHYSSVNLSNRLDYYPDTMIEETKEVLEASKRLRVDRVVIGGDFTHTARLSSAYITRLFDLFLSYDFDYSCVIGNHCCVGGDVRNIYKSPLGVFFAAKLFKPAPFDFFVKEDNHLLVFMPYMSKPVDMSPPLGCDETINILFTHYYMPGKYREDNLPMSYTNYFDYIFLGHDHDPFPLERVNRAFIIRPGALSRGTRHQSNWVREPQFAFLDTERQEVRYCVIPHKPSKEIFSKKRMLYEDRIRESKNIEALAESFLKREAVNDVSLLFNSMQLEGRVRERTGYWLRQFGLI